MLSQLKLKDQRIIFIRHGESIGNARGLNDESLANLPNNQFDLSELGRSQSHQAGKILKDLKINFDQVFISTYLRTQATWEGINITYKTDYDKPIIDSRLNEWWRGIWHTMNNEDIARFYPLEKEIMKREGWYHYRAPGGQSGSDVDLQIYSFLADFYRGCYSDFKNILIVGHGKWAILFWRIITGSTIDQAENKSKSEPFDNCSISVFDKNGFEKIS